MIEGKCHHVHSSLHDSIINTIDYCASGQHNCPQFSSCNNLEEGFDCTCWEGFAGKYCSDINECEKTMHICAGNSYCVNTVGSYECRKYSSQQNSIDITAEPCTPSRHIPRGSRPDNQADIGRNCPRFSSCTNLGDGFRCNCLQGFVGAECSDINECENSTNNCDENSYCVNTIGSFECHVRTPEKSVLVLNTWNENNLPILIDFNGDFNEEVAFTIDEGVEVYGSCGVTFQDEFYIFGGYHKRTQIAKMIECSLVSVGFLSFYLYAGGCTVGQSEIYLCFDRYDETNSCHKETFDV